MSEFVLGVRREDGSRWERRVPLAPRHVRRLINRGIRVIVQPSTNRVFQDEQYIKAGAEINEDLSDAGTIIAVKEVPQELLIPNKTYLFFSHTIKAQAYNMQMLDNILEKNIRLIDYEKIVDMKNQRIVRFGKWAGYAGMIDMLRAMGNRLLGLGYSTSFLQMGYSHMYPTLSAAKHSVEEVGKDIQAHGLPKDLTPLVFIFTGGEGACNQGALEIFKLLPHEMVTIDELPGIVANSTENRFVYGCVVSSSDYIYHKEGKDFNKQHFYSHPEEYASNFAEKLAPYASVIVNNVFWRNSMPRHITKAQLRDLQKKDNLRLLGVADIACDIGGGMEFLTKSTNIDTPVFLYDAETGAAHENMEAPGVLMLAVDNLPTEFPKEASMYFGDSLLPFLEDVVKSDMTLPVEKQTDLPVQVQKAVITAHGELTPGFKYIADLRAENEAALRSILVLGAGMCTPALLTTLLEDVSNRITVASLYLADAKKLAMNQNLVTPTQLDITADPEKLDELVSKHNLVISMMPAFLHVPVAKACIKHKKHLVTASYVSDEMKALNDEAEAAGLTFLNEVGLDPGIDHISAMHEIRGIQKAGGHIHKYHSVCGGLPAPEYANNPLGYKFSWNPRGVLWAGTRDAVYRKDGEVVEVKGSSLFKHAEVAQINPCFLLEVLPNRDSLPYAKLYGLDDAKDMFRGTLRFKGFSDIMYALKVVGFFCDEEKDYLQEGSDPVTWAKMMATLLQSEGDLRTATEAAITADGHLKPGADRTSRVLNALEWLGLFGEKPVPKKKTPIDALCQLLQVKLAYKAMERDLVILQHTFGYTKSDGNDETKVSTMIVFGTEGESAMSKTVGVPVGISAQLILDGVITKRGVLAPIDEEVYEPILERLSEFGISFINVIQ